MNQVAPSSLALNPTPPHPQLDLCFNQNMPYFERCCFNVSDHAILFPGAPFPGESILTSHLFQFNYYFFKEFSFLKN